MTMDWHIIFTYRDGDLIWRERPDMQKRWNNRWAGKKAGSQSARGYVNVVVSCRTFQAHRIIWEMFNGPIPEGMEIDHRDGMSNRIENLRLATRQQQLWNRKCRRDNAAGLKGVYLDRRTSRYTAKIRIDGQSAYLGTFETAEEAHLAYRNEAERHFGDFARVA